MPAVALRAEEPAFRASIITYATELCGRARVARVDVDDVVQQVLTEVYASLGSFNSDKGDFATWTRAIAWKVIRRHVCDSERRIKRFPEYHSNIEEHPAPGPSPERSARREQVRCAIMNATENLSAVDVRVFVLHAVDELTHVEISSELGISEAKSQKCYQRTRDRLARCLRGKVFSVMPPDLTSCDEPISTHEKSSPWFERSHYFTQSVVALMAVLLLFSRESVTALHESTSDIRAEDLAKNRAMYHLDKQVDVRDEPVVFHDTPSGKPEPAFLPSVPVVSKPTRSGDKPAAFRSTSASPSPTFIYKPEFTSHRPVNIR